MNGIPGLKVIRSISLYGLSDVRLTFEDGTDNYFARQRVFERLPDVELPDGRHARRVAAVVALRPRLPLRAAEPRPLGDGAEDAPGLGAVERRTSRCPAWPTMSWLGGETMQYQVRSIRRKLAGAGLSVPTVADALDANNGNAGGGFYSEGGQFYYVRGLGRLQTLEDIGNVVLAVHDGTPVLVQRRRHGGASATRRGWASSASTARTTPWKG